MKRKYVLAILVAIVLFLLYSRRVSGLGSCASPTEAPNAAGVCQTISSTTNVAVTTNRKTRR